MAMGNPQGGGTAWLTPGDKGCWGRCTPVLEASSRAWELILPYCTLKWDLGAVGDPLQHVRGDVGLRLGGAVPQVMVGGLGDPRSAEDMGESQETQREAEDMEGVQRPQRG